MPANAMVQGRGKSNLATLPSPANQDAVPGMMEGEEEMRCDAIVNFESVVRIHHLSARDSTTPSRQFGSKVLPSLKVADTYGVSRPNITRPALMSRERVSACRCPSIHQPPIGRSRAQCQARQSPGIPKEILLNFITTAVYSRTQVTFLILTPMQWHPPLLPEACPFAQRRDRDG
jgi:hypothetical protein